MKDKATIQTVYKSSSGKAIIIKPKHAIVAGWGVIINNEIVLCNGDQEVYERKKFAQVVANYHNNPRTFYLV